LARLLNLDLEGCEDNDIALADQAIRNHLLNNDDSLEVALIIMAMFCVYTIGVDNCSGKHVPNFGKFPTELDDNVNALVRRYEDNGVNALCDSLRLTNELVAIINILECGTRYDPLSGSVVTAAKNLAYRYR
jgi:hypothetical protein